MARKKEYTIGEAATFLGITRQWFTKLRKRGEYRHFSVRMGTVYYTHEQLMKGKREYEQGIREKVTA